MLIISQPSVTACSTAYFLVFNFYWSLTVAAYPVCATDCSCFAHKEEVWRLFADSSLVHSLVTFAYIVVGLLLQSAAQIFLRVENGLFQQSWPFGHILDSQQEEAWVGGRRELGWRMN